jgi:uncharacterized protein YjbI with pentapeptide repeats
VKAIWNLLIGVILGAVIGWSLGFLRFPYVEKNLSFLVGFITCFAFFLLVLILLFIWNKNAHLLLRIGKNPAAQSSNNPARTYIIIWILVALFIVFGGLISGFMIYRQNELFQAQTRHQNQRIQEQSELIESIRKSSLSLLVSNISDKLDDELKNHPTGRLSDNTIADIVEAFNYSFVPYRYLEGDSLSEKKLSPEKGELLLALCTRKIDSVSFAKIKHKATFSGADLRGANLRGVDLSGSDLKGADLSNADLSGASLIATDLRNADLWGAKLDKANLDDADIRRADLRWAELNEAVMDSANVSGSDLANVQLRKAALYKTKFRTSNLDGALLNEANMQGADLVDASFYKANLTRADLTKADFTRTNFNEAVMTDAELENAIVEKDWFEKLNGWRIAEAKKIQEKYKIAPYQVSVDISTYRLEKK